MSNSRKRTHSTEEAKAVEVLAQFSVDRGIASLHAAAINGDGKKILSLMNTQFGTAIDPVDDNGNTPLLNALYHGRFSAAKVLLAAGADVAIKNNHGVSPYSFCLTLSGGEAAELIHKIKQSMEIQETRLASQWNRTKSIIAAAALNKGSDKDLVDGIIPTYFETMKADLLERADELGSVAAKRLKAEINAFDRLDPKNHVAEEAPRRPVKSGPLYSSLTSKGGFFMRTRPSPFDAKVKKESENSITSHQRKF